MFISTQIIILFVACGSLLALITEHYPLGLSRLLEIAFDRVECRLTLSNERRRRSARAASSVRRSRVVETLADISA